MIIFHQCNDLKWIYIKNVLILLYFHVLLNICRNETPKKKTEVKKPAPAPITPEATLNADVVGISLEAYSNISRQKNFPNHFYEH